jgi:hypothetical protein
MSKDGIVKPAYFFLLIQIGASKWSEQRSFSDKTKEGSSRGPHEVDPASGSTKATASLLQAINCF